MIPIYRSGNLDSVRLSELSKVTQEVVEAFSATLSFPGPREGCHTGESILCRGMVSIPEVGLFLLTLWRGCRNFTSFS